MDSTASFQVYNASAGSGKTFTLVKEYLKILLKNSSIYAFQNILAITFTNKAAAEMKERILENLTLFSREEETDLLYILCEETGIDTTKVFEKSKKVLDAILQNYSAFHITTIDSFTHKLIRTFAYDLGLPLNFEVEMDGRSLLNEAVDVLISKIGTDNELTKVLIDFSIDKVNEDKSWDISRELNGIAKYLLDEESIFHLKKLEDKSLSDFKKLNNTLQKEKSKIIAKFVEIGEKGMSIIDNLDLQHKDFSYSDLPNFFKKLISFGNHAIGTIKFEGRLHTNISEGILYTSKLTQDKKQIIDSIADELMDLYFKAEKLFDNEYKNYVLIELVSKNLIPLAVLSHIQKELQEIKDQNNICLSAEFNQLISEKIKNEPAPFIYERLGEKYQNYFIDEMQDTSELQWNNLIPLIENALSQEKGGLLLVGDAKQSIYRWRGGKAEQFIELSSEEQKKKNNPFQISKNLQNLDTNYRSFSEIINFNNAFFTHISQFLKNTNYQNLYEIGNQQKTNKNEGGYVQLDFVEKDKLEKEEADLIFPKKVLQVVQELDANFKKSDVCVLVRTKKEGIAIANYLTENEIPIVSSETLLLQNSAKVLFLIDLLYCIQNPLDKNSKFKVLSFLFEFLNIEKKRHDFYEEFLDLELSDFFKKMESYQLYFDYNHFLKIPFYEGIEVLIRSFELMSVVDAYVQFFLDFVLEFHRNNYNDLSAFLEIWEQKKETLSISALEADDAIQIMTIHKSKGLEFPVVIFPCDLDITSEREGTVWFDDLDPVIFQDFTTSLVSSSKKLELTGEKGEELYRVRKEELALDNCNLLYVALTRAIEQLYIITSCKIDSKGNEKLNFFSGMFINFLKSFSDTSEKWESDKFRYVFGDSSRKSTFKEQLNPIENEEQDVFISTSWESHDIHIVANSSKNWGKSRDESIKYGVLIHEMLSKITTLKDIDHVVEAYFSEGYIKKEEIQTIYSQLQDVVNHPEIGSYFGEDCIVLNERSILTTTGNILIPDRLVFKDGNLVVIDYKTGKVENKYKNQINLYATELSKMGYTVSEKVIIYIGDEVLIDRF